MPVHQWLLLIVITAIPITAYVIIFSEMFYGIDGMKFAIEHANLGKILISVCAMIFAGLYILDAEVSEFFMHVCTCIVIYVCWLCWGRWVE